jgi:GNAT superfamily N-acetyltransferase
MTEGVDLSISQFGDAWRAFCASCPDSRFDSVEGMDYIFSGLGIAFFNIALVTGRDVSRAALETLGHRACAFAGARALPWLFVVTHEALAPGVDAAAALESSGLVAMLPLSGMVAQRRSPGAPVSADLTCTVPDDDAGCAAIFDVNAAAYAVDLDACKPVFGKTSFWRDHVPVLGVVDGKPVTSAAVLMVEGHRYVALVATDPVQQRRGYGEAAMRYALDVAARRHGERTSVLHATEAGRPIYERMGYETVATHTAFIEKRLLAGH